MTKSRNILAPRRRWTEAEDAMLGERYATTPTKVLAELLGVSLSAVYQRAKRNGLAKAPEYLAAHCRLQKGVSASPESQFRKGLVPWNKGKHVVAGGRSAETRFKPGARPQTWVPIGTVVSDPDGYQKRKVRDDSPVGMARRNWVFVHRELWEQHHGPIPPGHAVVFINRDKTDLRIENLELITRTESMRRNTVQRLPPELKAVVRLKGVLTRKIHQREQRAHEE